MGGLPSQRTRSINHVVFAGYVRLRIADFVAWKWASRGIFPDLSGIISVALAASIGFEVYSRLRKPA